MPAPHSTFVAAVPQRRHGARRLLALVGLLVVAVLSARRAGHWLVREDPPTPVDAVLVSIGGWYPGAIEAARLQRAGTAARLVVARWASGPGSADDELQRLGIALPVPSALVQTIFTNSGVPAEAIERIDRVVDGTGADVAALAAYVRARGFRRVGLVTARSHTRRAGWLLERALAADVAVQVHSPPGDPFTPDGWWRSRASTREVLAEGLRWINAAVFADLWHE